MTYRVQIEGTEPKNWRALEAGSIQDAAVAALDVHDIESGDPVKVYVAPPKVGCHANGAPMIVHCLTIQKA